MKRLFFVGALALSANIYATPIIVDAKINHVFVPEGFDNNDNVELVIKGELPNTCYSIYKTESKVTGNKIEIFAKAFNREGEVNANCERIRVPYTEIVRVGNLQGGNYQIITNSEEQKLSVSEASTNSMDEFVYASVSYIDLGFTGGTQGSALLVGTTPNGCYEFDRLEYISNKNDTLSVLPIMKKVRDTCSKKRERIFIPINYDLESFPHPEMLIFARSLEGKSVSAIVEKYQK